MPNVVFSKTADNVVSVNGKKFKVHVSSSCWKVYTDMGVYILDDWERIKENGVVSIDVFSIASDFSVCYCCPEFTEMTDSHRRVRLLQDNLDTSPLVAERFENIEFWSGACDAADISLMCVEYDSKSLSLTNCKRTEMMLRLAHVLWVMYYIASMIPEMEYKVVVLDTGVGITCDNVGTK